MIRLKNRNEFLFDLSVAGTQTAAANKRTLIVPFACDLSAIYGVLGTAGTTGTQSNDINKNGTSIFSGATKLDFASGATAATYGARTADPTAFAKGDRLTVDVDAIHTTAAVNLNLLIVLRRQTSAPKAIGTLTDAVE